MGEKDVELGEEDAPGKAPAHGKTISKASAIKVIENVNDEILHDSNTESS